MSNAQEKQDFDMEGSKDYVESVMISQQSAVVELSPNTKSGKKRNYSDADDSGAEDSIVKKSKCESSAKRKGKEKKSKQINDCSEDGRDRDVEDEEAKSCAFRLTRADVHVDAEVSTNQLIKKMNKDMHAMFENLTKKMDSMANEIETKLSRKFSQMLDKRINSEISKVKQEIDTRINVVKEDLYEEIKDLNDKVADMESNITNEDNVNNRELNIVLRNVPERQNENECDIVNGILKDGLRLREITVTKARRIPVQSHDNKDSDRTRPGVIVASLQSKDDKRKVMENKRKLNESRNRHKGVFIHGDQSKEERLQRANMKTLIDCIKQGDSDSLQLKGSRIVRESNDSDEHTGSRNQNRIREQEHERNHSSVRENERHARDRALRDRSDSGLTSESRDRTRGAPRRDFQREDTRSGRRLDYDMRRNNNLDRERK